MKEGIFEIILYNPYTNIKYPEREVNNTQYFVAIPGSEFRVQVKIDDIWEEYDEYEHFKLDLLVDGHGIGYCQFFTAKLIAKHQRRLFEGYVNGNQYYAFQFSRIVTQSKNRAHNANYGQIQLELSTAKRKRIIDGNNVGVDLVRDNILPEVLYGRQPSACTVSGQRLGPFREAPFTYHSRITIERATLHYHTSEYLDQLAGVVPRRIPFCGEVISIESDDDDDDMEIWEEAEKASEKVIRLPLVLFDLTRNEGSDTISVIDLTRGDIIDLTGCEVVQPKHINVIDLTV